MTVKKKKCFQASDDLSTTAKNSNATQIIVHHLEVLSLGPCKQLHMPARDSSLRQSHESIGQKGAYFKNEGVGGVVSIPNEYDSR